MTFLSELVGQAPEIEALRGQVERVVARGDDGVRLPRILLQGETGTGKGLLARAMHRASARARAPFVDINCGAIPESLLEAELFGYMRGAFTGAHRDKPGLFHVAHGGTLFLDEVAALPLVVQAKLLTALEDNAVRRVGGTRIEQADVWVVSATHVDLPRAVREGSFREDLYHRLAVLTFTVPPLRTRGPDLLALALHLLRRTCQDYGLSPRHLSPDAERAIREHAWPGNVRELANAMERAALLADTGEITAELLGIPSTSAPETADRIDVGQPSLEDAERREILRALAACGGNLSRTAKALGIARNTLKSRLERYGVRPSADAKPAAPTPRPAPAAQLGPMRWERRLLAYLQATGTAGADPLQVAESLQRVAEKVRIFGGRVEEIGPVSLVAVFGLEPVEDPARRAALAALASLRDVAPPLIALAVHCEPGRVGRAGPGQEASIDPETKHPALGLLRALVATSGAGHVAISRAAALTLQRRFELEPTTDGFRLRGGERAAGAVFSAAASFVGRDGELALLRGRFAQAAEGRGQVVSVFGDAGIGKSRLVYELRQQLGGGPRWLEARCLPFDSATPLSPFAGALRSLFGLDDLGAAPMIAQVVTSRAEELGIPLPGAALLASLVGASSPELDLLAPDGRRAGLFEAIAASLFLLSRERPLVLVVEDLHWADGTTGELVERLAEQVSSHSVLLITTQRIGKAPPWLGRSNASQLSLPPLSQQESIVVLRAAAGSTTPLGDRERSILEKSEGNPFFIEELTRHAIGQPGDEAEVPDSVQGVLAARIARLDPPLERWLLRAAVLGRDAPRALLQQLGDDRDLDRSLAELCRLEFLVERRPGELFAFRHALTHEVAYQLLTTAEREDLHALAVRALEVSHAGRLDDVADALAHHAERSRDHARAIDALVRFADRARGAYALIDALSALERARARLGSLGHDARRAALPSVLFRQAHVLSMLGRFGEALERLTADVEDVEATGAPDVLGPHAVWRAAMHSYLGQSEMAQQMAARGLSFAQRCGDRVTLGRAHYVLSREGFFGCRFADGVASGLRAIEALSATPDRWWLGQSHCICSWNYFLLGELRESLAAADRVADVGRATGDVRMQVYAHFSAGYALASGGEIERALARSNQACAMAADPVSAAFAQAFHGFALLAAADVDGAVVVLDRGVAQLAMMRLWHQEGIFRAFLADAQLQRGDLNAARCEADRALKTCRDVAWGFGEAWALRVLGQVAEAEGAMPRAAELLREALERFAAIDSRLQAARTAVVLAKVLRTNDRAQEALAVADRGARLLDSVRSSLPEAAYTELAARLT